MGDRERATQALALVGMPGSGKSHCARLLRQAGYPSFRFGRIIIDELTARGLAITAENERIIREELREKEGMTAIARRALPHLRAHLAAEGCVVLDGLYGQSEYLYLREALGVELALLAIVAPRRTRYERLAIRLERLLSAEEAEKRDLQEIETLEKGGPIAFADYTILNDRDEATLGARLKQAIAELNFGPA